MPARNISQDPKDYKVVCTPDRFGDETVIYQCVVTVADPAGQDSGGRKELLRLEVELNISDTESFHEMRQTALRICRGILLNAAHAIGGELEDKDRPAASGRP